MVARYFGAAELIIIVPNQLRAAFAGGNPWLARTFGQSAGAILR